MVRYLPAVSYQCFVSIANAAVQSDPLQQADAMQDLLERQPNTVVLRHAGILWVQTGKRHWAQQIGDCLGLLLSAFPRVWHLFNTIRQEKINLVHTNVTDSLEGALAAALAGVPHIWHIREKHASGHMILGRRFSCWLIERLSDLVICDSAPAREQFERYKDEDPDKYRLIHNAVPLEASPRPLLLWNDPQRLILKSLALNQLGILDIKAFRVGYVGLVSAANGFDELLDAFTLLRKRGLLMELLVTGCFADDVEAQRVKSKIEQAQLMDWVHFLGEPVDRAPVYEVLDLLVAPSLNPGRAEAVVEAMANGVPCIGVNAGAVAELIESHETGWLYPAGDAYALSGMIEELGGAFWKLETIRQNARRMVCERFNIESQIRMLQECYQSVIIRHQF